MSVQATTFPTIPTSEPRYYEFAERYMLQYVLDNTKPAAIDEPQITPELSDEEANEIVKRLHGFVNIFAQVLDHLPRFTASTRTWEFDESNHSVRDCILLIEEVTSDALEEITALKAILNERGVMEFSERDDR